MMSYPCDICGRDWPCEHSPKAKSGAQDGPEPSGAHPDVLARGRAAKALLVKLPPETGDDPDYGFDAPAPALPPHQDVEALVKAVLDYYWSVMQPSVAPANQAHLKSQVFCALGLVVREALARRAPADQGQRESQIAEKTAHDICMRYGLDVEGHLPNIADHILAALQRAREPPG